MRGHQTPYQHWDWFIRVSHWSVAILFFANYWMLEEGDDWHQWAGYLLFVFLCVRLVRGFVGPENGRFRDFFPTPSRVCHALRNFQQLHQNHQCRHTPVAGAMVMFLLASLTITAISGWMQELDAFWGEDWVQNLHAWSADAVMVAVAIHIAAVLWLQWRYKLPLVLNMLRDPR